MGELHEKYQQRLAETTNLQNTELTNLRTGYEAATADNNGLIHSRDGPKFGWGRMS